MVARKIRIGNGTYGKTDYYYWDTFQTWEEAKDTGIKIKEDRKKYGETIRYFIIEETEGRIYPITRYRLYFDKKMRLI